MVLISSYLPHEADRKTISRIFRLVSEIDIDDLVLPDVLGAEVVISFGGTSMYQSGPGGWRNPGRLSVFGGFSRAVAIHQESPVGILSIATPPGCACLLGVKAADLRDRIIPLNEVSASLDQLLGHWCTENFQRLKDDDGFDSLIEEILDVMRITDVQHICDELVTTACGRIVLTHGSASVSASAAEASISPRHFTRRFTAAVGINPGRFIKIARFASAWSRLSESPDHRLADIAQQYGFADQSHLDRDFRSLAGNPPSQVFSPHWYEYLQTDGKP